MDIGKLAIFSAVKKRLSWVTQRQEVLAQNIANADTPGFRSRDLKPYDFKDIVRREAMQVNMVMTGDNHLGGARKRIRDFSEEKVRIPYETSPDGNAVVLEEQMQKINETSISHKFTTELYRKHMGMIRMALGRN